MKKAIREAILEKDKLRGLVPSRAYGRFDLTYGAYMDKLNPRGNQHVQMALATSSDPRFREFLDRIQTKRYKRMALQTIAKACGIDLKEFSEWWSKASSQQAIVEAQNGSIAVVQDMIEDAKSTLAVCERCDGATWIPAPQGMDPETPGYRPMQGAEGEVLWIRDCPVCQKGKVRKIGDPHSRDRILEMSGLINKNKGMVAIVQNFGGQSHSSAVTDLDDVMPLDLTAEHMD